MHEVYIENTSFLIQKQVNTVQVGLVWIKSMSRDNSFVRFM